jgi:hypothetical protein
MKIKLLGLFLVSAVLLSACSQATPTSTEIPGQVYTVVAQTLTALYTPVTDTPTPLPATETPMPTATSIMTQQTPTKATVKTPSSGTCDNAVLANDVTIPDNTVLQRGQKFTKIWAIKNTGSCNWSTDYALKFYSGDKMDGHQTAITKIVYAGNTTTISIQMVAPNNPGTYTGTWSMINDKLSYFGKFVWVKIIVK